MPFIEVVNKHNHNLTKNDFYIGRGSVLGNPYTSKPISNTKAVFQCNSREESISKFEKYILKEIKKGNQKIKDELNRIYKKVKSGNKVYLVCFCKPRACHGDVIRKLILSKL